MHESRLTSVALLGKQGTGRRHGRAGDKGKWRKWRKLGKRRLRRSEGRARQSNPSAVFVSPASSESDQMDFPGHSSQPTEPDDANILYAVWI